MAHLVSFHFKVVMSWRLDQVEKDFIFQHHMIFKCYLTVELVKLQLAIAQSVYWLIILSISLAAATVSSSQRCFPTS